MFLAQIFHLSRFFVFLRQPLHRLYSCYVHLKSRFDVLRPSFDALLGSFPTLGAVSGILRTYGKVHTIQSLFIYTIFYCYFYLTPFSNYLIWEFILKCFIYILSKSLFLLPIILDVYFFTSTTLPNLLLRVLEYRNLFTLVVLTLYF
jgi:hypothetical protein